MLKRPKGEKPSADVIGNAVKVMRIAVGEDDDALPDDGKNKAAQALIKLGGATQAKGLTAKRRKEIAKEAQKSRWG
jgi:hypothetical protein